VTVALGGERFADGAKLRAVTPAGVVLLDTDFVSPTHLDVHLDLEDEPPTTWQVRVVNPDNVISNSRALDVVVPSPAITGVVPPQVFAGELRELTIAGTGLGASSQCHLSGAQLTEIALPSAPADPPTVPATLECTLDAASLQPGSYQIWVVNNGTLPSNMLPLAIVSAAPTISDLSPSVGQGGTVVAVTVTGTGFDITSTVLFDGIDVGTTYYDATLLYVSQLVLPTCGSASCDHPVLVRNPPPPTGGPPLDSNAVNFRVGAAPPEVTSLSPGSAYQGEVKVVTFQGTGFPVGSVVQAAPPSGAFFSVPSTTPGCPGTCTQVSGTLDLTGQPEGSWLLRVGYPGGSSSATFSFRVLSNAAVLQDATPRGGAQGAVVPVTLTAGNLRPPLGSVRVRFDGQDLVPTGTTATTVTASLNLAGKNTGTYALQVVNPGASPSNALSFNVTPGPPTLSSVSPGSAPRQDTPVTVTLTGTNFAKPDAGGTGGSAVHISAPELGVTDYTVPAARTTVMSPTQILVSLDTRIGVPGEYDIAVWNPGGPTPPQKSNVLADAFEILP
jgi:hypothetical protein